MCACTIDPRCTVGSSYRPPTHGSREAPPVVAAPVVPSTRAGMLAAALGLLAFGAERKGQPHILFILADVRHRSSKSCRLHA